MNKKLKIFLFITFCFSAETVFPQIGRPQGPGGERPGREQDTIKFEMKMFNLVEDLSRVNEVKLDTFVYDFHTYNPVLKNLMSAQTLGNLGSPYQSNDFFMRDNSSEDFLFAKRYKLYGMWPTTLRFYNTTKPFTLLEYGQWFSNRPRGETWLRVLHTQNINSRLNVGISYNSISSQGKYLNQEAKDNNLHFFTSYNGERYDAWFAIGRNRLGNQENGGLPNPQDIENPDLNPENIAVWLNGANTEIKNTFGLLSHQYKLGVWKEEKEKDEVFERFITRVALMHTLEYSDNSRNFTEVDPNPFFQYTDGRGMVYFYGEGHIPNINATPGTEESPGTRDKSSQRRISNQFFLKSVEAPDRKFTFGKQAFIGNDIIKVFFPREKLIFTPGLWMPPLGLLQTHNYSNSFVGGSIFRTEGRFWNWNATGRYYFQGYKIGDFNLHGFMEKPIRIARDTSILRLTGAMTNTTPDYFYNHYYSNHYRWNNNFDRTYELRLGANYESPGLKLKAGFRYSIITNYVFMNEQSLPDQSDSEFSVMGIFLNKDFKIGILNLENWLIYQKTTTERYLHLPQFMARNKLYIEGVLSKVLQYHIGVDTRYETNFYADYYNPALGMFYLQNNEKIGNYPWMDGFADLKMKRTRFYVKYSNLGALFMEGGYFTTPNYPAQPPLLGFGISWTFYD